MQPVSNFTADDREDVLNWSGYARHMWRLLVDYDDLAVSGRNRTSEDDTSVERATRDRYDVTLALGALQAMMTNFVELELHLDQTVDVLKPIYEIFDRLREEPSVTYRADEPQRPDGVNDSRAGEGLTHLRNALSHPRTYARQSPPTTGFTTSSDGRGEIETVTFVSSPDVTSTGKPNDRSKRYKHVREDLTLARTYTWTMPASRVKDLAKDVAFALAAEALTDLDRQMEQLIRAHPADK